MAFKGVVDTEAYVIDGYQAPVDYFNPAESVSDYILPQNYFTFSEPYVFASLTLFPAFTLDATAIYRRTIEEYTWDDFAESSIIDRTWDEWFGDQWDSGGVAFSLGIILDANGGHLREGTLSITAFNSQLTVGSSIFAPTVGHSSAFTVSATPTRLRDVTQSVTGAFSTSTTGNATFSPSKTITANASTNIVGSATFDPTKTITANATTNFTGNATFGGNATHTANATVDFIGGAIYGHFQLTLNALYSQLSIGRVIELTDPFNIIKVNRELRTIMALPEERNISVLQETRVNTIVSETRDIKVSEETRKFKIFRPNFTNRSSIPRIRQET